MVRQQRGQQYPRVQQSVRKSGMEKFSTSLDTVQQVLGMIHSSAPYIEKYGPVVQKLPTMYRMYRAMKDIDKPVNESEVVSGNKPPSSKERYEAQPDERLIGNYPSPTLYI